MPYTTHQGVRLHYRVEGEGPPLVLQHGFTGRLESWQMCGYVRELRKHARLILLDARGHGRSDAPHDPAAYTLSAHVGDVVAVLDALDIPRADYLGYSMGGWIGFGMARHAPERLRALLVGGAHPYRDPLSDAFGQVDGADPDAFIAALETAVGEPFPPQAKPLIAANDLRALSAAARDRPSLEETLPGMTMPCLLYVGEADARRSLVEACAQRIPGATFLSLPGLTHLTGFARGDLVSPHIVRFLASLPR